MSRDGAPEDMAVEEELESGSEGDAPRRSSPLDLRQGDDAPRRFPFSISSLLERGSEAPGGGAPPESDSEGSDAPRRGSGGEDESDAGDDEEGAGAGLRPFQPYTFTHTPFVGGLLPHLGLLPPISAAAAVAAAGLNSQGPLMSMAGPGGVIRVPAHRPSVGAGPPAPLAGVLPAMGSPLPWLAGLTPLERTAAVAHHLSALAPLAGKSASVCF